MAESLRDFCRRYGVLCDEEPRLLSSRSRTWLLRDVSGGKWVAKPKSPHDQTVDLLAGFSVLHPTFHFSRPVSAPDEPYWLYPYVDGEILAGGPFEEPPVIALVTELAGRLQALLRSLVLVPFYRQAMRGKGDAVDFSTEMSRFDPRQIQRVDDRHKAARHAEISRSYQWTEQRLKDCGALLESRAGWPKAVLDRHRDRACNRFSIHVPITGSNLAHTAWHPEHLLLHPDGGPGVIGWRIEPRPRFHMLYTYLAWSFLHSMRQDAKALYLGHLAENSSKAFYEEHHLVFALCLVEQSAAAMEANAADRWQPSAERLREARELFAECVEQVA